MALQVPAARLGGAAALCREVARASGAECFVLADTSYGECCVDELCAGHLDANCVVHFGEACLSPTQSIPALCVLERAPLDVGACATAVTAGVGGEEEDGAEGRGPIVLLYELRFAHCAEELGAAVREGIRGGGSVVVGNLGSRVLEPEVEGETGAGSGVAWALRKGALSWDLPSESMGAPAPRFVWVGSGDSPALLAYQMAHPECSWYVYEPGEQGESSEPAGSGSQPQLQSCGMAASARLRRRYYLVQRAREAAIFGIVVGTLGVKGYGGAIDRLRRRIEDSGRRSYTFSVGRITPAKLANFPEVDVFVLVSCPQCSLLDSREFYAPVITPYEAELALDDSRAWPGNYSLDFNFLTLEQAKAEAAAEAGGAEAAAEADSGSLQLAEAGELQGGGALVTAGPKDLQGVGARTAGEFLQRRTYQGLAIPETGAAPKEASRVKEGWSGRAAVYDREGAEKKGQA